MIPNESGKMAPPAPWMARPAISTPIECESAQTSEPKPKIIRVMTSSRSLPNMSPSRPTTGVAIEADSRYPVRAKVTSVVVVPSFAWISGRAGAIIVCDSA